MTWVLRLSSQHLSECLGTPFGGSQGLWACNTQGWVITGRRVRRGPLWGSPSTFQLDSLPQGTGGQHPRYTEVNVEEASGPQGQDPWVSSLRGTALSCFVTNSMGDFGKALPSPTVFLSCRMSSRSALFAPDNPPGIFKKISASESQV